MASKDSAAIRDQLGNDPDTIPIIVPDYDETVQVMELPTIVSTKTLGHVWIVGSATNAIVGTWTGTEDGAQLVVGSGVDATDGRVETVQRVVSGNNTFIEQFGDTLFKDTTAPNTANWNTTLLRLEMDSGTDRTTMYNVIATTKSIFLNSQTVYKATLNCDATIFGNDVIKYFLSADGGTTWEEVSKNVQHVFTTTGTDLRAKIIMMGVGANATYLEYLRVSYA